MKSARDLQIEIQDAVLKQQIQAGTDRQLQGIHDAYGQKVWVNPDDWQAMRDYAEETSVGPPLRLPAGAARPLPDGVVGMLNGAFVYLDTGLERGAYRLQEYAGL